MSFNSNLDSYHELNKLVEGSLRRMDDEILKALPEEREVLMLAKSQFLEAKSKEYQALGEEMAEIMKPRPWWKIWGQ